MSPTFVTSRSIAVFFILQSLLDFAAAAGLATITPCQDCAPSFAPRPITVTAQYETLSTCVPSTTTITYPRNKRHSTTFDSTIKTIPSCSPYAWVSTSIPCRVNESRFSSLVTATNQPVTFNSHHYTQSHTTTILMPNRGYNNTKSTSATIKVSETTIDIKSYCDYDSIGPIAVPGYGGSGLCTDCGPDPSSALTQRYTVVSCADRYCTTFNETRIASPTTFSADGRPHTSMTIDTYCPTATPTKPIPAGSVMAPTVAITYLPTQTARHPLTQSTTTASTLSELDDYEPSVSTEIDDDEATATIDGPQPTYDDGAADPSGNLEDNVPAPTPYQPPTQSYKKFRRQALEKPRGRLVRRAGLLYFEK